MNRTACLFMLGVLGLVTSIAPAIADETGPATEQTHCPVLVDNPINKSIYTDYKGKRVYFCCDFCKAKFTKEPEKYLANLPQFQAASADVDGNADEQEHDASEADAGWRLYRFTEPLGVTTYSLLILTACTGLLRRKLKQRFLKIHKPLALSTVTVATLHALTVLLGH